MIGKMFNKSPTTTRFELVTERGNGFYSWNGQLYESDIVRSCIRPMANAMGKLVAQHLRSNTQEGFKINPDVYIRFLLEEPNPYMTGQMLQEKMTNQLALNNNAFALIVRDDNGYAQEIYPIPAVSAEALYDKFGTLYLRFFLRNGKSFTFPYSDIIHIRTDYVDNDVFGEPIAPALANLMDIVTTTDQGIVKAIKNSSVIKWILKFNTTLRPEDLKQNTKDFVSTYLSIDSDVGGAAATDSKFDAKQVDPKDYVPNAIQMDKTLQRIYSLFGTNDAIVQNKYDEDQWNAYWESRLEPIAIQMSNEWTRKIFNRRERSFGNVIVFNANNLQYASMATKLQLVQMVDRGALTPNEWRAVMNLPPIAGGDDPIRRLDTAVV
ncbi:MAG: phage portal protein [Bacillota bacterium]|nr:phage portal protein [Bacillota bacterium]